MKALVTGSAGFIGSHLCEELLKQGYSVNALVRYTSTSNIGFLRTAKEKYGDKLSIILGDIRDQNIVYEAAKSCEILFNLAALIGIPYSYSAPQSYIETNVIGCLNILNAAKKYGSLLIQTSTSEVYGSAQYIPIDEKHPLVGQSPYSASKIASDQLALSFYRSFGTQVIVARPFNTYGPRQSQRAIIPTVLNQCLNNKSGELKVGNIDTTRDFNYVLDTVKGFIELSKIKELLGECVNISTGYEISIKNLIALIQEICHSSLKLEIDQSRLRPNKSEVERLCGCPKLIMKYSNWSPEYSGEEGLKRGLIEALKWMQQSQEVYGKNDKVSYMV